MEDYSNVDLSQLEEEGRRIEKDIARVHDIEARLRKWTLEKRELEKRATDNLGGQISRNVLLTDAFVLYGGSKVNFDQARLLESFIRSERSITHAAIHILFAWLDSSTTDTEDEATEKGDITESERQKNLHRLLGTLAIFSGLRKHKWVELSILQDKINSSQHLFSQCHKDIGTELADKDKLLVKNKLRQVIDEYLWTLERIRRLHWDEIVFLNRCNEKMQKGAYPSSKESIRSYIEEVLLNHVKTYTGRYGFHMRSIGYIDGQRKIFVDLRARIQQQTDPVLLEKMKASSAGFDEYKTFTFIEELEEGVAADLWPRHAIPLFLY